LPELLPLQQNKVENNKTLITSMHCLKLLLITGFQGDSVGKMTFFTIPVKKLKNPSNQLITGTLFKNYFF